MRKIGTVGQRDLKLGLRENFTHVAVPVTRIPTPVRWCFLLFVCSLPFEELELSFLPAGSTIPKLCGFLFFACYVVLYCGPFSSKRSFPSPPRAMRWFLGYVVIFALRGLFDDVGEVFVSCFQLVQLIALFWIASDLLKDTRMARSVLLAYSIVSGLIAVASVSHVPGFSEVGDQGRVTALEMSSTSTTSVLGAVITIGLWLYGSYRHFVSKILLLLFALCLLVLLVTSGSRTFLLAFVIGVSVYMFPYWRSKQTWKAVFLVIISVAGVLYITANDSATLQRWLRTYYEGDTSGRDVIYEIAADMILEKPLLGWSVSGYREVGRQEGGRFFWTARAVHNNFLDLLLTVGIVGATPFFVGLWLCGLSAWRARLGNLGLLPLALLMTVLVCGLGTTLVTYKTFWLILALTLGAAPTTPREMAKRSAAVLVGRRVKSARRASLAARF
jgi:O-antigen ligase